MQIGEDSEKDYGMRKIPTQNIEIKLQLKLQMNIIAKISWKIAGFFDDLEKWHFSSILIGNVIWTVEMKLQFGIFIQVNG